MTRRALLVLAAVGVFLMSAMAASAASMEDLSKISRQGALPPPAVKTIEAYVAECVGKLKAARDPGAITRACKTLANGYEINGSIFYQIEYARAASTQLLAVLEEKNHVKQIQTAMLIANMPQYTVQPALEKMATNADEGVRHWVVRGYRLAGGALIQQGPTFFSRMMATLEAMGLKDDSGIVVGDTLIALNPYGASKPADNERLRKLQAKIVQARCADLRKGKEGFATGFRRFLATLEPMDANERKAVTQMIADVLDAATSAFAMRDLKEDIGRALIDLINTAEPKLVSLTNTTRAPLQVVANKTAQPLNLRGAEVRLIFNEYWREELVNKGIKLPPAGAAAPVTTGP